VRATIATPGPWESTDDDCSIDAASGGGVAFVHPYASVRTMMATGEDWNRRDVAFIAHAREDIPWLVAEVRRLREVARLAAARLEDESAHPRDVAYTLRAELLPPLPEAAAPSVPAAPARPGEE
jgi:hypothetical protein